MSSRLYPILDKLKCHFSIRHKTPSLSIQSIRYEHGTVATSEIISDLSAPLDSA